MAKDAKLEQLKVAQDQTFSKKQDAYQTQQRSWDYLLGLKDKMNRAFETKQKAFEDQERAWRDYRSVSDRNGPRIERLNSDQERTYQNMKDAFDKASSAHDSRDGASAKAYANEGHGYKSEAQRYVEERRQLVEDCRSAKARHEPYKRAFEDAKIAFGRIKDEFEKAKATHERANAEFKRAKADFDAATKAFQSRLNEVKVENTNKKESKRALAIKAGVPYQYQDDVYISNQFDGAINIYFGGVGKPDGFGHGHYTLSAHGEVVYKRDPFDPHGTHNFTESVYWHKEKMSFDRDTGTFQTDNYIGIVGSTHQKSKAHIAINENGDIALVRDIGGEILYSRKDGIGHLPDNLDWSK